MPSPVGHILAGAAIGLACAPADTFQRPNKTALWRWVALPAILAALPDADLLIPYAYLHRQGTHSIVAVALVFIVTMVVTGKVNVPKLEGRRQKVEAEAQTGEGRMLWAFVLAASYGSHLLLDLLGVDPNPPSGIQLLWPFSDRWFISGIDWFPGTERRWGNPNLIPTNLNALFVEVLTLGPLLFGAWLVMRTRRSRVRTSGPDSLRPPSA